MKTVDQSMLREAVLGDAFREPRKAGPRAGMSVQVILFHRLYNLGLFYELILKWSSLVTLLLHYVFLKLVSRDFL